MKSLFVLFTVITVIFGLTATVPVYAEEAGSFEQQSIVTEAQNSQQAKSLVPRKTEKQAIKEFKEMFRAAGFPSTQFTSEEVETIVLNAPDGIPFEFLTPEVLVRIVQLYHPDEYYIDFEGLHWGDFSAQRQTQGACYSPYAFGMSGWFHFVYWFSYLPTSYDAYLWPVKIQADWYRPYKAVLVKKRDICYYAGCNPAYAMVILRVCAK